MLPLHQSSAEVATLLASYTRSWVITICSFLHYYFVNLLRKLIFAEKLKLFLSFILNAMLKITNPLLYFGQGKAVLNIFEHRVKIMRVSA